MRVCFRKICRVGDDISASTGQLNQEERYRETVRVQSKEDDAPRQTGVGITANTQQTQRARGVKPPTLGTVTQSTALHNHVSSIAAKY